MGAVGEGAQPLLQVTAIRVLIAEDHALVREGTREVLEKHADLVVVGEADRGDVALELIKELRPDVALVDVRMPGLSGLEVAARAQQCCPDVRVLIVSGYDEEEYIIEALARGASGYLLKSAPGTELASAIRAVHSGATVLQDSISKRLALRSGGREPGGRRLSTRELEIVRLIAVGKQNKEVARELGISLRTVETHLNSVFSKLGVSTRTEAVIKALEGHLINLRAPV